MPQTDRNAGLVANVAFKAPCRVATIANITLSGLQTVDGVSLAALDRVLVKTQTNSVENGIYTVDTGAWSRAKDFNGAYDVVKGTLVIVNEGNTNKRSMFRVTSADPVTIGTDSITFEAAAPFDGILSEFKTATAGQTVFTLANAYTPGINSLEVYVNGLHVNSPADYTETNSTTVTFTSGLQLNDEVLFLVRKADNLTGTIDAANVSYTPAGAGAVARNVKVRLDDVVNVKNFGAVGDGVTDDTAAIIAALNFAAGRPVGFPKGIYLITSPLSGTTATDINIIGETPAFFNNIGNFIGSGYNELPSAALGAEYTVILCNNCNLIGAPDTASMNGSNKLRSMTNIIAWGRSGAKIGIYNTQSVSFFARDSSLVLFEQFGLLQRSSIFTELVNFSTFDCGWNRGASGSGATYESGCGVRLVSNIVAGDFTTVNPVLRETTFSVDNLWTWVRADTGINKSGMRGLQTSGLLSGSLNRLGSHTGSFFYLTAGVSANGMHLENFALHGLAFGDNLPRCIYQLNSTIEWNSGLVTNNSVVTVDPWQIVTNGTTGQGWQSRIAKFNQVPETAGKVISNLYKRITVVTPGGTDNYDFSLVVDTSGQPHVNKEGFMGIVTASIIKTADFRDYTRRVSVLGTHKAGVNGWKPITETNLFNDTSIVAGFAATIVLSFNNADLRVAITWGASWPGGTEFELNVGLFGHPLESFP